MTKAEKEKALLNERQVKALESIAANLQSVQTNLTYIAYSILQQEKKKSKEQFPICPKCNEVNCEC